MAATTRIASVESFFMRFGLVNESVISKESERLLKGLPAIQYFFFNNRQIIFFDPQNQT
jgi:hypothetical protein